MKINPTTHSWAIQQYNIRSGGIDVKAIKQMRSTTNPAVMVDVSPEAKNMAKINNLNQGLANNGTKVG